MKYLSEDNGNNNSYMASYYSGMIEKYTNTMNKIQGILTCFDDCVTAINKGSNYTNRIIINSKSIDDGKLSVISSNVTSSKELLNAIISECSEKITEYTNLYNSALNNPNK